MPRIVIHTRTPEPAGQMDKPQKATVLDVRRGAKISLATASRWPQIPTVLGAAATLVRLVFACHDSHPSKGSCYLLSANWIKSMVKNLLQRKKQSLRWSTTFIRDENPNADQIRMMVISWIYYIL